MDWVRSLHRKGEPLDKDDLDAIGRMKLDGEQAFDKNTEGAWTGLPSGTALFLAAQINRINPVEPPRSKF